MPTLSRRVVATGVALALSCLVLNAVGAGGAAARTTSGSARPPTSSAVVVLTNASDGSTVLATKGELVVVKLTGVPLRWSEAQAVETSAVLTKLSGSTSTTGSSTTTFEVGSDGTAVVEATGTPLCTGTGTGTGAVVTSGCPPYVLLWHATVEVPQVDPPAAT